jgi:hypothetical protein
MNKFIGGIILVIVFVLPGAAQGGAFQETEAVKTLMDHYIRVNKEQKEVEGWRIQLITTTDRREMDRALYKFKSRYPGEPIVWKHISPYYHVKVGAYQNKLELQGLLIMLKKEFPSAIAVREKIEKTDLL